MAVKTPWMPDRETVAAHAHHSSGALDAVADDDEAAALCLAYGNAEAAVVYIRDHQGAEAALALLEVYAIALRQSRPANSNMSTVMLQ